MNDKEQIEKLQKEIKDTNTMIATNTQVTGGGLVLRNFVDMKLAAETFISSRLVPASFDNAAKVLVAIQAGAELGFKPWQALNTLHVVNGKVGISSSAIGGLIRQSGVCKYLKQSYEGEYPNDEFKAIVESQRDSDKAVNKTEFSIADAKQAELWNKSGTWQKYPKLMLMYRALSQHGRMFYGDVLMGHYTEEELHEIRPPDQQPTTEVLPREQRKEAENVVVTDSKDLIREYLTFLIQSIIDYAEKENNAQLYPDTDKDQLLSILDTFTVEVLHPEGGDGIPNYRQSENFTVEKLKTLINYLNENGLTPKAKSLLPDPFATNKDVDENESEEPKPNDNSDLFGKNEKPKNKKKKQVVKK